MASNAIQSSASQPPPVPAAKRKNNKRNRKPKPAANVHADADADADHADHADKDADSLRPNDHGHPDGLNASPMTKPAPDVAPARPHNSDATTNGHARTNGHSIAPSPRSPTTSMPSTPGAPSAGASMAAPAGDTLSVPSTRAESYPSARLDAMSQSREELRSEVEQLRRQLESVRASHEEEVGRLKSGLEESEAAKERAETDYENLMGRVEKIRESVSDRLKRHKAELDEAKDRAEELETANEELQTRVQGLQEEATQLRAEAQERDRELTGLRSRSNLSQHNWQREKNDLARQVQSLKTELDSTSNAMGEWEVIALEERSKYDSLTKVVADLEDQLVSARDGHERASSERDTQARAIDGLQRALQEIQEARKRELREMVESSEEQLETMKRRVADAESRATVAEAAKETLSAELGRTAPFEKEVKEKNLLIGKLRHEAIVLNDHLTKALKYIKKTKPEEMIDRQIVTNHFLQFLALDRSDSKRFQILQVIAGLLNWTDEQREQAGLARPGTSGNSLRLPISPFHRTPSSPGLKASELFNEPASLTGRESLADLWAGFLEQSVSEASGGPSRKASMSSVATVATRPDTRTQS